MTPDDIKWCCVGFKSAVDSAGNRGFAIFVDDSLEPVLFVLQHRALDPGAAMPDYAGHMSVITEVGIQYCPWCGKSLMRRYRKHLRRLAREDVRIKYSPTAS